MCSIPLAGGRRTTDDRLCPRHTPGKLASIAEYAISAGDWITYVYLPQVRGGYHDWSPRLPLTR